MFDLFFDDIVTEVPDANAPSGSVRDNAIKNIENARQELQPYPSKDSPEWDSSSTSMYKIILAAAAAD